MHVSFDFRNNFNNNANQSNIGNKNPRPFPSNNNNSYGNPYDNAYANTKSFTFEIDNMLKEFITSQKAFNKTVEEKLEKLDTFALKVDNISHDVEMLKIRTSPLGNEKVKPLNSIQFQIDENIMMLAQLKVGWDREEEKEDIAKNLSMSTTLATIHVIEDLKTFNTHHTLLC